MMTITETETFTSPCGCPGCEKWADCAYCEGCEPEVSARWEAEYQEWLAQELENEKPFGEWMFG